MAKAAATATTAAANNILDVLIIGAGWSGLSAALKLSQAGRKVAVLEARERIGGRAFTHTWSDKTDVHDHSRTVAAPSGNARIRNRARLLPGSTAAARPLK